MVVSGGSALVSEGMEVFARLKKGFKNVS